MANASIVTIISAISVAVPLWLLWKERQQNTISSGGIRESPPPDIELRNEKSFADILEDKGLLELFQEHLQREFALENLMVSGATRTNL